MRVALIGAGSVSTQYLSTLALVPKVEVVGIADRHPGRVEGLVETHSGIRALSIEAALDPGKADLVLNLTTPISHEEVSRAVLDAGLDLLSEKPFGLTAASSIALARRGQELGASIVCAPDTVLGTGVQTARRIIDDGGIGRPIGAHATMVCAGHERWHPQPEFFYRNGGGPLFDMGPYHLSALVHLLGPVRRVIGAGRRPQPTRTIGRGEFAGRTFDTDVDTHETALLLHHSGAVTTLVMSFDSVATRAPDLEVFGTLGSLTVPDPNHFGGSVGLRETGKHDWAAVPELAGYQKATRGIGLVDLLLTRAAGEKHRATMDLAVHVVEIIEAVQHSAAQDGEPVDLTTEPDRPAPVPLTDWLSLLGR